MSSVKKSQQLAGGGVTTFHRLLAAYRNCHGVGHLIIRNSTTWKKTTLTLCTILKKKTPMKTQTKKKTAMILVMQVIVLTSASRKSSKMWVEERHTEHVADEWNAAHTDEHNTADAAHTDERNTADEVFTAEKKPKKKTKKKTNTNAKMNPISSDAG